MTHREPGAAESGVDQETISAHYDYFQMCLRAFAERPQHTHTVPDGVDIRGEALPPGTHLTDFKNTEAFLFRPEEGADAPYAMRQMSSHKTPGGQLNVEYIVGSDGIVRKTITESVSATRDDKQNARVLVDAEPVSAEEARRSTRDVEEAFGF